MNVCIIQHVFYESPGLIQNWLDESGYYYLVLESGENPIFPGVEDFDALIVMGGPMGVNDENTHPWLIEEKEFINEFIQAGKRVLGVCLGSQLVSSVLGAKVIRNKTLEIGWFPITVKKESLPVKYQDVFSKEFITFHWHGDTFELPEGAVGFASSKATSNQGYIYKNVAAFQFHLEVTPWMLKQLIEKHASDLNSEVEFVQSKDEILNNVFHIKENKIILYNFLDKFLA
jgi:GMP synthase-like glutamine amidotransferase